jgi:hypothetical protein
MWVVETIEETKGYLEYEVTIRPKENTGTNYSPGKPRDYLRANDTSTLD